MEEKRSNLVLKFYRWRYIVIFPGQNKLVCYFAGWGRLTDRPLARQMVTIETAEIVKLTQSIFSLQYRVEEKYARAPKSKIFLRAF